MKTKMLTSMIIIVLVAGMILTLPVSIVQAGSSRQTKTYFEGTASFAGVDDSNVVVKQFGDYVLTKGLIVQFNHVWESFGEGFNVNNPLNSLLKPDGTTIMWGQHVLAFGSVTLTGYFYGKQTPDGPLTVYFVDRGDGIKVIWRYVGDLFTGVVSGVIIEL